MVADDPSASIDAATEDEIHHVQRVIEWLLRGGLIVAVILMAIGLALKISSGADRSPPVKLFSISSAPTDGDRLMAIGVLVLAATPAMRVLALLWMWARERDWRFVGVACAVVVTLAVAVLVGHG